MEEVREAVNNQTTASEEELNPVVSFGTLCLGLAMMFVGMCLQLVGIYILLREAF